MVGYRLVRQCSGQAALCGVGDCGWRNKCPSAQMKSLRIHTLHTAGSSVVVLREIREEYRTEGEFAGGMESVPNWAGRIGWTG